jgi:hypothetical protein
MGSTRSSDGGDIDASESSGADGIYKGVAVERGGGRIGLTLTPHRVPPSYTLSVTSHP